VTRALSILLVGLALMTAAPPAFAQRASPEDAAQAAADPRRQAVTAILRTPRRDEATPLAEQHARALRALDFDVLPIVGDLLNDSWVSAEGARAILVLDEVRALPIIMRAVPAAPLSTQMVAFVWFLEHENAAGGRLNADAYAAAMRALVRIESTAVAQLAIYTIGMVGSKSDFALLEEFATPRSPASLRMASEAALSRLGSEWHTEMLRSQLAAPAPAQPGYLQAMRTAQMLRQAAFSLNRALVPAVCGHISDAAAGDIDVRVDPGAVAAETLNVIATAGVDPASPSTRRRSRDEWQAYCRQPQ
jgi:hypothetical protein